MKDFENRLRKNFKHIRKWAKRQNISCFRIYDFDLPNFPLSIELYEEYIHVSEYRTKHQLEGLEHAQWLSSIREVIAQVCDVSLDAIFFKLREQQKGLQQYEKLSHESFGVWVDEFGAKLWVNLTDYLDTGLFLDHRVLRTWVKDQSQGKRVLNLFAYTGAFSVQAAMGGAKRVDTVDMSQTYLSWAEKNMKANGFTDPRRYGYIRADILQWLPGDLIDYYDIIILDPPTFSNSKKMKSILDIQRDHVGIIHKTLKALKPDGTLFFSNNFRGFKINIEQLEGLSIKEVSQQTVPNDYRNKSIHQSYVIKK